MEGVSNSSTVISIRNDEGTEMKKLITTSTDVQSSQVPEVAIKIDNVSSTPPHRFPSRHLLDDNQEARDKYMSVCVPLYNAALTGDWQAAEKIIDNDKTLLRTSISTGGFTLLHLAAGSHFVHFVEQLVKRMEPEDLELRDDKGNTAMCFAAATGTVQVARILLHKNKTLVTMRGGHEMTPLYMATLLGNSEMARFLYEEVIQSCDYGDRGGIFFNCIYTRIYDLALKMVKENKKLATARDKDKKTALHLLAQTPEAFDNGSSEGWSKLLVPCFKYKLKMKLKRNQLAHELVKYVLKQVLSLGHENAMELIRNPELLFDAARSGNFEFLSVLIKTYPDLAWEHDSENRSIIHFAIMYRYANIFNMIYDIGPIKDLITTYEDSEGNNLLHLAAKLPPVERLNIVSGPALQMQQELLWFQEVKRIIQPLSVKNVNKKKEIPEQIFSHEHKKLQQEGEEWMKNTGHSCTLVATLITTVVFTAAFTLPGGINDDTGVPIDLPSTAFMIFLLSDGLAFLSSVVSIMMFLSILTSRYAEYDFYKSLPLKLMIGLASLFFSVMTMVVAFCATFAIACHSGLKWVPLLISIIAFVPIALFILSQSPLLFDTLSSTYWSRTVFQPTRRNIVLY